MKEGFAAKAGYAQSAKRCYHNRSYFSLSPSPTTTTAAMPAPTRKNSKVFRARTTNALYDACQRRAKALGTTQGQVINMLVERWLDETKEQAQQPQTVLDKGPVVRYSIRLPEMMLTAMNWRAQNDGFPLRVWIWAVLRTALGYPIPTDDEMDHIERMRRELNAMGRNINQIARAINAARKAGEEPDFESVKLKELNDIHSFIANIEVGISKLIIARSRDWSQDGNH